MLGRELQPRASRRLVLHGPHTLRQHCISTLGADRNGSRMPPSWPCAETRSGVRTPYSRQPLGVYAFRADCAALALKKRYIFTYNKRSASHNMGASRNHMSPSTGRPPTLIFRVGGTGSFIWARVATTNVPSTGRPPTLIFRVGGHWLIHDPAKSTKALLLLG